MVILTYYYALPKLKEMREAKYTQEQLAAAVRMETQEPCTRSFYAQIEAGIRPATNVSLCIAIAKILGVGVDEVFSTTKPEKKEIEAGDQTYNNTALEKPVERAEHELT